MKEEISNKTRLSHILQALNNLESFVDDISYDEFMNSQLHKSAVTNELQVIGEAVSRLSDSLKSEFPEIEWKGIKNLRNIVVHEYFAIDYSVIWELIKYNSQELREEIESILKKIKE